MADENRNAGQDKGDAMIGVLAHAYCHSICVADR